MLNDDLARAADSDRTDAATASDADTGIDTSAGTSAETGTGTGTGTGMDTPVFHATVQALAAATFATDATAESVLGGASAVENIDTEPEADIGATTPGTVRKAGAAKDTGDAQGNDVQNLDAALAEDWIDQRYGDPSSPTPVIDPDTPEGAAILSLFRRIKNIEEGDGSWPGGDVVTELTGWFTELGIDPDEHSMDAGHRLRLVLRERPRGLASSVHGVRISTDNDDPEAVLRIALHVLARQLGLGTSIELVSHDRELLTRVEHHSGPNSVPTAGS